MYSLEYCPILPFVYSYIAINCITKCTFQRRRCCAFDSPGLPNDSAGYPGLVYVVRGTTPSVLRFFWLIRHRRFHCKRDFTEKAQHLRRWIPMRMLTRGRLVPRQPRAIKRTTPTALRDKTIMGVMSLIMKRKMICVISSRKTWQNTLPFDAFYRVKWRKSLYNLPYFTQQFVPTYMVNNAIFHHALTWTI